MENPLKKRLDHEKYLHAVAYVEKEARGIKKFGSNELAHLNQLITGHDSPWRAEPVHITIPSGETHLFNLISNPQNKARDLIGTTREILGNDGLTEAAFYLYSNLVREHLFRDANRRTAVLATLWVYCSEGIEVTADDLLKIQVGNLRNSKDLNLMKTQMLELIH